MATARRARAGSRPAVAAGDSAAGRCDGAALSEITNGWASAAGRSRHAWVNGAPGGRSVARGPVRATAGQTCHLRGCGVRYEAAVSGGVAVSVGRSLARTSSRDTVVRGADAQ